MGLITILTAVSMVEGGPRGERASGTGGPLKPDFGLSGDVTRHRLSPTDKLNCPPCHGGLRVLATMQQAVRDDGDRVGMDDTKTRKSGRKTLSISELPHSSQNRA